LKRFLFFVASLLSVFSIAAAMPVVASAQKPVDAVDWANDPRGMSTCWFSPVGWSMPEKALSQWAGYYLYGDARTRMGLPQNYAPVYAYGSYSTSCGSQPRTHTRLWFVAPNLRKAIRYYADMVPCNCAYPYFSPVLPISIDWGPGNF
jgi:hypothetical protein